MKDTRSTTLAYIKFPHFVPVVAVLAATGALAWLIAGDDLDAITLLRLLMAMLGGQLLIGVVNEVVDEPFDRQTKPDKPLPSGLVSHRGARAMGIVGVLLMLVFGGSFGWESLLLLLTGTAIGIVYSVWFKRSSLAWVPYLLALPLLPIWVAVTFDAWDPALLALYPLGALGVLAVQIAQSVPDVAADTAAGIDSLTTRLGETKSMWLVWLALLATLLLALGTAVVINAWSEVLVGAGLIAAALVLIDVLVYRNDPRQGVLAAFPVSAMAVGLLAVAWVAVVID